MNMKQERSKTIWILSGIIIVLVLILLYFFIVQPSYTGFIDEKMNEGYNYAIVDLFSSIQAKGYVEIPVGENQSLILVPYLPPQQ